ncbi:SdrD B-like domain-containing protein [Deinococcus arenae]|uniref:SdrD B-like domain-containing protein n=1 Tax=Deinococcus arenae TaxID=1452751 RepID=UPI0013A6363F|nr:SdrD B-like domain-containing protein [Deinococcus arenae]
MPDIPPSFLRFLSVLPLLGAPAAAQATQVSNTAQLRVGATQLPSNTVTLQLAQACLPRVTPDGMPGAPGQRAQLRTPGLTTLPYRVTQGGTQAATIDLSATAQGVEGVQVRVQTSAAPDATPLSQLTLQPGESRDVTVAVLADRALAGDVLVNLAARCGDAQDPVNTSLVTLDPSLALLLSHTVTPGAAEIGDRATFTLTLPSPGPQAVTPEFRVQLPPGVTYLPGSAQQGGAPVPATLSEDGRSLILSPTTPLRPGETGTVTYQVTLGPAAATQTVLAVEAQATAVLNGTEYRSPVATARVRVRATVFDQRATLIGSVYRDLNGNGARESGEPGVAGARVLLSNGAQVLTDTRGEYTFRQLLAGPWRVQLDRAGLGLAESPARLVDVSGLSRADFPLPPAAAPVAPGRPAGTEGTGLIRLPLEGSVIRSGERVNVTLQGPPGTPLRLLVNGEPVPDTLIGEAGADSQAQRARYVGVPLRPGLNTLEAVAGERREQVQVTLAGEATTLELSLAPGTQADGRTPVSVQVRSLDARGVPSGQGAVTLTLPAEPLDPDIDPATPGYQIALRDGEGRVRLTPQTSAATLTVAARLGELRVSTPLTVPPAQRDTVTAQASVGVRLSPGGEVQPTVQARAYTEQSIAGGELQVAVDTAGLPRAADPTQAPARFPVVGSGQEARAPLTSDVGFAFRYDHPNLSAGYYDAPLTLTPLTGLPRSSALRVSTGGNGWQVQAFLARVPGGQLSETFEPDGGRTYRLTRGARPGSEVVSVVRAGGTDTLTPGRDYVFDPLTGTVTLASGLTLYGRDFGRQTLIVTYVPDQAAPGALAFGVGVSTTQGPWTLDAAAARVDQDTLYGVQVAYRSVQFSARAAYVRDPQRPGGQLSTDAHYRSGPVSANATLSYAPVTGLTGSADLSYQAGPFRTRLSHTALSSEQRTLLSVDRALTSHLSAGAGVELVWPGSTQPGVGVNAVALVRYAGGPLTAELSHAQPLLGPTTPQTRLNASVALSDDTALQARLIQDWQTGLTGEVGVQQALGAANLDVTYQLPSASGQGSRARLGLSAPLTFSDHLSGTVGASVTRDMTSGQLALGGTFGVRYTQDHLIATLGVDGSTGQNGLLLLRGGLTGERGAHTFGLDARVQLRPTLAPNVTFSHAWRAANVALLQVHTLAPSAANGDLTLSGEAALNVQWPRTLRLDLSPSVAYRWILPRPDASVVQAGVGVGVGVGVTDRLGFGVNGFLIAQPGQGLLNAAYGAELRYLIVDGVRLVAGYTVTTGDVNLPALTPAARPGAYLRLDLTGGK